MLNGRAGCQTTILGCQTTILGCQMIAQDVRRSCRISNDHTGSQRIVQRGVQGAKEPRSPSLLSSCRRSDGRQTAEEKEDKERRTWHRSSH